MFTTTPRGGHVLDGEPEGGPADTVDDDIEVAAELLDAARVVATLPHSRHPDQHPFPRPRSARGAASGATTAEGTIRSRPTSPTAVAPPSR
jgi:hypothetical protein